MTVLIGGATKASCNKNEVHYNLGATLPEKLLLQNVVVAMRKKNIALNVRSY